MSIYYSQSNAEIADQQDDRDVREMVLKKPLEQLSLRELAIFTASLSNAQLDAIIPYFSVMQESQQKVVINFFCRCIQTLNVKRAFEGLLRKFAIYRSTNEVLSGKIPD